MVHARKYWAGEGSALHIAAHSLPESTSERCGFTEFWALGNLQRLQTKMSFRKRNIGVGSARGPPGSQPGTQAADPNAPPAEQSSKTPEGVRPSPLDGRPTTSTGTASLDHLLGGHAGLPLGNSLLIEENGTTDFAGTLLKYYAGEGVVQGHKVHVVGMPEQWGRELPGVVEAGTHDRAEKKEQDKMKIAWRYERLGVGEAGTGVAGARGGLLSLFCSCCIDISIEAFDQHSEFLCRLTPC